MSRKRVRRIAGTKSLSLFDVKICEVIMWA